MKKQKREQGRQPPLAWLAVDDDPNISQPGRVIAAEMKKKPLDNRGDHSAEGSARVVGRIQLASSSAYGLRKGAEMECESEHNYSKDWRLHMTDELFMQINGELGPPMSVGQEFSRYQIAREAANEFWDWIAARGPERPVDWRARNDRMLTHIFAAAMAKARTSIAPMRSRHRRS